MDRYKRKRAEIDARLKLKNNWAIGTEVESKYEKKTTKQRNAHTTHADLYGGDAFDIDSDADSEDDSSDEGTYTMY